MIRIPGAPVEVLDGELERDYRAFRRREEIQWLSVAGVVASVALLAFIYVDLRLVESPLVARSLLAGRLLVVGLIGASFFAAGSTKGHVTRDRWVILCTFGVVLLDVAAAASRPPGAAGPIAIGPVIVLLLYVAVPGPQGWLVPAAGLESVGTLAAAVQNELPFPVLFSLIGALVLANWLGFHAMSRMNRWGREQFLAYRHLADTNESLQDAAAEIRILREMIPVCASCKRIRDDRGFWEHVDVYLRRNLGGKVTHGICPSCYQKLYGDVLGKE